MTCTFIVFEYKVITCQKFVGKTENHSPRPMKVGVDGYFLFYFKTSPLNYNNRKHYVDKRYNVFDYDSLIKM